MLLNELYRKYLHGLQGIYNKHEASVITSMIFESIAGINKSGMIIDPRKVLDKETVKKLRAAFDRLLQHTPVQYVTGEAWFYKMKFIVSPAVLIPRPETEEIVEEVIHFLHLQPGAVVLDIGTGSGCIAIAIKKNLPGVSVSAIEISKDAMIIAEENAIKNETTINFLGVDFLNESALEQLDQYDVIVSNPPYIPLDEKENLEKNVVDFEPHIALFTPAGLPLLFFEKIAAFGKIHLKRNGKIFLEVHEDLAKDVAGLFNNKGYHSTIKKDLFGKERLVMAIHSR